MDGKDLRKIFDGSTSGSNGNNSRERNIRSASKNLPANCASFRQVVFVDGVKTKKPAVSYSWDKHLEELQRDEEPDLESENDRVLPVTLFGNPPLGHVLKVMHTGLKLEVRHYDYDVLFPDKQIYWIANVNKIVGYRLLMRYEGMEREGDDKYDFWINIGSDELKHVNYCATHENCELLPPNAIRKRQTDWARYIVCKLHACKTLTPTWDRERQLSLIEGRFKDGTRLELLDRHYSNQIRPARVIYQLGRRICVRVCLEDVDEKDMGNDQAQIKTGVWCDENWDLIFPVGWAQINGWKLTANQQYIKHCEQIKRALAEGREPEYESFDASLKIFNYWAENRAENTVHWEVGMKFECLDPLNQSFLELKVASCLELLSDGYLKVGFDGPDMEIEAIPIHCTSPYLFPVNYAYEHGIKLVGPLQTVNEFSWKDYLRQSQAIAAPGILFDVVPPADVKLQYKIGAKLEATDQCESHLICPATVHAVRGRLLQIRFDGWNDEYDQLFDYRSRDLFPLGWCEMYGYKLEIPKGNDLPTKRKKK